LLILFLRHASRCEAKSHEAEGFRLTTDLPTVGTISHAVRDRITDVFEPKTFYIDGTNIDLLSAMGLISFDTY
jgi:hypothetical protein